MLTHKKIATVSPGPVLGRLVLAAGVVVLGVLGVEADGVDDVLLGFVGALTVPLVPDSLLPEVLGADSVGEVGVCEASDGCSTATGVEGAGLFLTFR